jgi:hypothetical protein
LLSFLIALVVFVRIVVRLVNQILLPGFRWIFQRFGYNTVKGPDGGASSEPPHADGEFASTSFYLWCTIVIPCAIFVLTTDVYFYHYFFVMCPFVFVLLALCLLPWRRVLLALVIAQALLTHAFLSYIHDNGGTRRGEYGTSYSRQGNQLTQ